MEISKKTLLILAGGLGSRYKSLKQIDPIIHEHTLLEFSLYDALKAGFNKVIFIINEFVPEEYIEKLSLILKKREVEFHWVIQKKSDYVLDKKLLLNREKPWGTGHAVLCAENFIHENFIVINADDYYGFESYKLAIQSIKDRKIDDQHYGIITYPIKNTVSLNGSVSRGICQTDKEFLTSVDEQTSIYSNGDYIYFEKDDKKISIETQTLVSMNFWILNPSLFKYLKNNFHEFLAENPGSKDEFYLPSNIDYLIKKNIIKVYVDVAKEQWKGVTYLEDKNDLKSFLSEKIQSGNYPEKLWN